VSARQLKARFAFADIGWGFLFFAVCGVFGTVAGAFFGYTDVRRAMADRDALRATCVAGNDRACKLYEVDYGR
jgi:hypothetical protein